MSKYQLTERDYIINKETGGFIPKDNKNKQYKEYLEWVDAGNTPDPVPGPTKEEQIEAINQKAMVDILAIAPEYRQRNMIARSVELMRQPTRTPEEEAELDSYQAIWDQIKAIRAQSDADILALG